jgi:hypothetical protein
VTYCPRCGESNHQEDRFCSYCGQDLTTYGRLWNSPAPATPAPAAATAAAGPAAPAPLSVPDPPLAEAPHIPSYLGWAAALTTICWPAFWAGVVALVYAGRTQSRLAAGDLPGARKASGLAKTWCWITLGAGLALWVLALSLIVAL